MRVALSLDLDLAKLDQSRFHISMFCWLELQDKGRRIDSHPEWLPRAGCSQVDEGEHGEQCAYHQHQGESHQHLKGIPSKHVWGDIARPIFSNLSENVEATPSQTGRADNAFQINSG